MTRRRFALFAIAAALTTEPDKVRAYDMDCAIMLCMAGGFPSSAVCSAAYAEMIRRITPWPTRPPFGICTYAAVPIALGGSGGINSLDTSTREYAWLHRTRVLWWRGRSYKTRDDSRQWEWSIRSCDHQNNRCYYVMSASASYTSWPSHFTSENGQKIQTPHAIGSSRAVMMEFGDYEGNMDHTGWMRY